MQLRTAESLQDDACVLTAEHFLDDLVASRAKCALKMPHAAVNFNADTLWPTSAQYRRDSLECGHARPFALCALCQMHQTVQQSLVFMKKLSLCCR